jgi:hypothetical protein
MARMDLDAYRHGAEEFVSALDREYYLHFSGQQDDFEIEQIYDRHADLFTREAVDALREDGTRQLLEFAVQGLIGRETRAEQAELARREAELEIEVDGERIPFRAAVAVQTNERDPERRQAIELARNAATEQTLNPLLRELQERSHTVTADLGWASMLAMCEELSGIDLRALSEQTGAFLEASHELYRPAVEPQLSEQLGIGFEQLRRADLPAFFRAPGLDALFPANRLLPSLAETLAPLGIDLESQSAVHVDTEARPRKSPRAFCAAVRVPDEVYLVIAPVGGRDDFAALFHEAGHTEHYAHVDPSLPVEQRAFGDNSVTEGFAFLFEHLTAAPEWLRRRMGVEDPADVVAHHRAVDFLFQRRYCAKLGYELELQGAPADLDSLRATYARRLSDAVGVEWPEETWLSDVDPFFYAARYLRAWALESHLRRLLEQRFGPAWFEEREAGDLLIDLWRRGQRDSADQLLGELTGGSLDFSALLPERA